MTNMQGYETHETQTTNTRRAQDARLHVSTSAPGQCTADGHAKNCYMPVWMNEKMVKRGSYYNFPLYQPGAYAAGLWVSSSQHHLPPRRCRRVPPRPLLAFPPPFSGSSSHAWMRLRTVRFGVSWSMRSGLAASRAGYRLSAMTQRESASRSYVVPRGVIAGWRIRSSDRGQTKASGATRVD